MNAAFLIQQLPQDAILVLKGVTWRAYLRFLRGFEEEPGFRLIYEKGTLEIWAPRTGIHRCGRFSGRLVVTLTEEFQLPVLAGGSTTLRCRTRRCGIEADECFWIENTERMGARLDLDLHRDPPPDLAIEAEAPSHLSPYLQRALREADENPIIRDFRKWVRSLK